MKGEIIISFDCETNLEDFNKIKTPIVKIKDALNEYENKVLFPEKLAKANEMLKNVGLPKQILHIR